MIKTTAINNTSDASFLVIWDIGKRCNFDCSYCSDLRHTNDSPHSGLDTLIETYEFIKKWSRLYNQHNKNPQSNTIIDFTGGEPTNNPNFWKLVSHIKKDDPSFLLGITTNGSWHEKNMEPLRENIFHVTCSIHFEADPFIKERVLKNIIMLHEANIPLNVNVMLHTDRWDEVMRTCNILDEHGISYNPVPIGDGPQDYKGWRPDNRGVMRRTAHDYTPEQQEWFFKKMNLTPEIVEAKLGNKLGRECCGRRCLVGKVDNEWQPVKLVNTEFENWYCMVDWYFLCIDQEKKEIFHHQTCQALRGKKRGTLGSLDDKDKLLAELEERLSNPVEPIICPMPRCGCGMCVPKARDLDDFKKIWYAKTDVPILEK